MKVLSALAMAVSLSIGVAVAENRGLSYLGLCSSSWPCDKSLAAYDGLSVIRTGWIEQTFGERCGCADRLLQDRRPKEVRIHIANGACLRNKRCGSGEIFKGFTIASANRDLLRKKSRIVARFVPVLRKVERRIEKSRGPLTCYISPVLESDLREEARLVLHRISGAYLPNCTLVDNPNRGRCLPHSVCEKHGDDPDVSPPCITDLDGTSALDINPKDYLRKSYECDISLLWSNGFNCNNRLSDFSGEPRKRNCAVAKADIDRLVKWLRLKFR